MEKKPNLEKFLCGWGKSMNGDSIFKKYFKRLRKTHGG